MGTFGKSTNQSIYRSYFEEARRDQRAHQLRIASKSQIRPRNNLSIVTTTITELRPVRQPSGKRPIRNFGAWFCSSDYG